MTSTSDSSVPKPTQNQDRLKTFFKDYSPSVHNQRWNALWEDGSFLPWDRGHANPALIDLLNDRSSLLPPPLSTDGTRRTALVPGCGKGYDVTLFCAHGYNGIGLEVSEHAVGAANAFLKNPGEGPLEGEYKVKNAQLGPGSHRCLQGDFFEDDWIAQAGGIEHGFDVIYDNTFLCALDPTLRPKWSARIVQLLAPGGVLVCLEFPTHKPPASGGPPWALPSPMHEELLRRPGQDIAYEDGGRPIKTDQPDAANGLVRIAHWQPQRTHAVGIINGDVKDRVSVWRRK